MFLTPENTTCFYEIFSTRCFVAHADLLLGWNFIQPTGISAGSSNNFYHEIDLVNVILKLVLLLDDPWVVLLFKNYTSNCVQKVNRFFTREIFVNITTVIFNRP